MRLSATDIATAWYSVKDSWIVRRNKMREAYQWEVVHDWGGVVISEETMKVEGWHATQYEALAAARLLEDEARGEAVLRLITQRQG